MTKPIVTPPSVDSNSQQEVPKKQKKKGKEHSLQVPELKGKQPVTKGIGFLKQRPGQD